MIKSEAMATKIDKINQDDYKSKMNQLLCLRAYIFILCFIMFACTLTDNSNETIEEKKEYTFIQAATGLTVGFTGFGTDSISSRVFHTHLDAKL